jgi:predicted nucleic acid-binding protein
LIFYADASFLVSLYSLDANSAPAASLLKRAQLPLPITPLGEFEFVNAISLRVFRKEISPSEAQKSLNLMADDVRNGILLQETLSFSMIDLARRLSLKYSAHLGTRALDVLHVASALSLKANTFLTFDLRQRKLAHASGLRVL